MPFQPPAFRQPPQYQGISNLPMSFDGIIEAYKQAKEKRALLDRQGLMDTMQYGAPLEGVNPQDIVAQGASSPAVEALRAHIASKKQAQGLETREKEAGIGLKQAEADWMRRRPGTIIPASENEGQLPAPEMVDIEGTQHLVKRNPAGVVVGLQPVNAPRSGETTAERESAKAQGKARVNLATARTIGETAVREIGRVMALNANSYGSLTGSALYKLKSKSGVGVQDEKFKNTADVLNTMKGMVAKVLKSTFGGQLSDSERAYLNEVYGAVDSMSIPEREIAMRNVMKTLQAKVSEAQGVVSELGGAVVKPKTDPMGIFK